VADIGAVINAYLADQADVRDEWRTLKTPPDSGGAPVKRRKRQAKWVRYRLIAEFSTYAAFATFRAFFDARCGAAGSFTWDTLPANLGGGSHTDCEFPEDALDWSVEGPEEWSAAFTVLAYQ